MFACNTSDVLKCNCLDFSVRIEKKTEQKKNPPISVLSSLCEAKLFSILYENRDPFNNLPYDLY